MVLDTGVEEVKKSETPNDAHGGNLLSLASHELRTPLSIVKWYTEMLLDGDAGSLTDDQTKYLRTIQTSNQRAIDLIRSLLNVSRLDLGTFSINPIDIDLETLVKQILGEYKTHILEKKLTIEEIYERGVPLLSIDKQISLVIIRSIIANAILFSKDENSISIHISEMKTGDTCNSQTLKEDSLVFSVTDYGIGIPFEDQPHIFSRFFKASNAVNDDSKGAGLSLYMVKLILSKTGGDIWFTSTKDSGSTFCVTFPKRGMIKKEGRTTLD